METALFNVSEIYVGRDFGTFEYEITPELVRKYIAGTGDDNPWYTRSSPLGGPIAPALILHSAPFRTLDWYLPNLYGNLHAREECEFFGPVMVGERLTSRSLIVDRYLKRDREYVVNETLIFNAAGRLLTRLRVHQSFLVERPAGEADKFAVDRSRERAAGREFKVGERGGEPIEAPTRRITEPMCIAFSGPSRNYHTDRAAAREWGFPEIVVQGMLSVCLIAEMMTRRFAMGFICGGRMDVKLVNVLWCDETAGAKGLVVERRPEGRHTRAAAEVWCEKTDGTKTIVGSATALEI
ncbi:MAG TPA: MaoC family dehydratase N-terminal domain-containing protein [Candidatus Binataceae bacterium]|nr:MaoC family dehydratase N-terminal domain-containing protein [Candidatus Binataceae bacterium]